MMPATGRWRGGGAILAALVGLVLLAPLAGGGGTTTLLLSANTTSLYNGTLLYYETVQGAASTPVVVFGGLVLTDDVPLHLYNATVVVAITTGYDASSNGVQRDQLLFNSTSNVTVSSPFAAGSITLTVNKYTNATIVQVRSAGRRPGRKGPILLIPPPW